MDHGIASVVKNTVVVWRFLKRKTDSNTIVEGLEENTELTNIYNSH